MSRVTRDGKAFLGSMPPFAHSASAVPTTALVERRLIFGWSPAFTRNLRVEDRLKAGLQQRFRDRRPHRRQRRALIGPRPGSQQPHLTLPPGRRTSRSSCSPSTRRTWETYGRAPRRGQETRAQQRSNDARHHEAHRSAGQSRWSPPRRVVARTTLRNHEQPMLLPQLKQR
jgi:hypothetical protein